MEPTLTQYGVGGCLTVVLVQMILNQVAKQRTYDQFRDLFKKLHTIGEAINRVDVWHAKTQATHTSLEKAIGLLTETIKEQTKVLGAVMDEIKEARRRS